MPAAPVSFRWDSDFIARIDAARGQRSRSAFVREAVRTVIEAEAIMAGGSLDVEPELHAPRKTLRQELDECGGGTPLPPKVPPRGGYR